MFAAKSIAFSILTSFRTSSIKLRRFPESGSGDDPLRSWAQPDADQSHVTTMKLKLLKRDENNRFIYDFEFSELNYGTLRGRLAKGEFE
jgi:hypothetical protein